VTASIIQHLKKILVEILKKYGEIIENKKSNSHTMKEKDMTWNKITKEYNATMLLKRLSIACELQ